MFIKALITAICLLAITHFLVKQKRIWPQIKLSPKRSKYISGTIVLVFLVWAYIIPVSYYFPHNNNGVTGDNYFHIHRALTEDNYLKNHHILFPWIAEKLINGTVSLSLTDKNDPNFLEKAFNISTIPVKSGIIIALILLATFFYWRTRHIRNTVLLFFLSATSFSVWVWGIQSNALGIAIAMEMICVVLFGFWFYGRKLWQVALLALFTSIGVFCHNGFLYFAIGVSICSMIIIVFDRKTVGVRYSTLATFISTVLIMTIVFYLLEARINHTYNIQKLFDRLSDTYHFGSFRFGGVDLLGAVESNLWAGVNWFGNYDYDKFYLNWASEQFQVELKTGVRLLRIIQLGAMFSILIMIIISAMKGGSKPIRYLFFLGLATSIIFLIGFTLRQAASRYYTLAVIPNLILIISFTFSTAISVKEQRIYSILIILLISSNFIYNGFTRYSVFQGSDIEDHPYYSENVSILSKMVHKNAVYYRDIDVSYYPNLAMSYYYKAKFGKIKWIPRSGNWNTKQQLIDHIQQSQEDGLYVFLGPVAYSQIAEIDSLRFLEVGHQIRMITK